MSLQDLHKHQPLMSRLQPTLDMDQELARKQRIIDDMNRQLGERSVAPTHVIVFVVAFVLGMLVWALVT